ncbi:hypothetical protein ACVWZV_000830 [Bradyrhizobium sp. GM5.1]|uniref:hypothetical protein n=1 Tax=Bradyrhizobium sp. 143 TaxID=2782619 RepID=UPI001FF89F7E|nr:hypothetical protein [Bradyrhizobium sp. 143]
MMLDDERSDGAAKQVFDVMQRIAVMGKPRREAFKALDKLPELRELDLRETLA